MNFRNPTISIAAIVALTMKLKLKGSLRNVSLTFMIVEKPLGDDTTAGHNTMDGGKRRL